jgi:hypothetical protein
MKMLRLSAGQVRSYSAVAPRNTRTDAQIVPVFMACACPSRHVRPRLVSKPPCCRVRIHLCALAGLGRRHRSPAPVRRDPCLTLVARPRPVVPRRDACAAPHVRNALLRGAAVGGAGAARGGARGARARRHGHQPRQWHRQAHAGKQAASSASTASRHAIAGSYNWACLAAGFAQTA